MSETLELFADEQVELLPERTTMQAGFFQNGNLSIAVAVNAGNINFGGNQLNAAVAAALAGSNVALG
ncbi:hypothetical protein [Geodermatophilus sp. URMC 62]|uniref:hypothetical protein n=1 Tax=Geodermatophilus sp. URMC 62 TaxID=3423414 RepID=UPI00406C548B